MDDDIKKYKKLVESYVIESYEDRVAKVVQTVANRFNTGVVGSKEELLQYIDTALEYMEIPDARAITVDGKPSNAKKEFIKDVLIGLKGKIKIKKSDTKTAKKAAEKSNLDKLARIIQTQVSDTFPDGDPIDSIIPHAMKLGMENDWIHQNLNKAAKLLGAKDYYTYMADFWDQIKQDNPDFPGIGDKNPWK